MSKSRLKTLLALAKGLTAAVAATLLGMVAIAAVAVFAPASDGLITALNQALKTAAIVLGTTVAVGRGGERGFVTGMALSMFYMALGYGMYLALGGGVFSVPDMLGEILIGAAIGAVCGAVLSNLPPKKRKRAVA